MAAKKPVRVFISHAGTNKRDFADYLYNLLKDLSINVFLDQHSLEYSALAAKRMEEAVHEACVGTRSAARCR
jgi:hypothetical protein